MIVNHHSKQNLLLPGQQQQQQWQQQQQQQQQLQKNFQERREFLDSNYILLWGRAIVPLEKKLTLALDNNVFDLFGITHNNNNIFQEDNDDDYNDGKTLLLSCQKKFSLAPSTAAEEKEEEKRNFNDSPLVAAATAAAASSSGSSTWKRHKQKQQHEKQEERQRRDDDKETKMTTFESYKTTGLIVSSSSSLQRFQKQNNFPAPMTITSSFNYGDVEQQPEKRHRTQHDGEIFLESKNKSSSLFPAAGIIKVEEISTTKQNASITSTSSTSSTNTALPPDFQPLPYSVIVGKGNISKDCIGNRRLQVLASLYLSLYAEASNNKRKKSAIVSSLVSIVQDACRPSMNGAAFIRFDTNDGKWHTVSDIVAREKVGYTLRELLGEKYKSTSKAKAAMRSRHAEKKLNEIFDFTVNRKLLL